MLKVRCLNKSLRVCLVFSNQHCPHIRISCLQEANQLLCVLRLLFRAVLAISNDNFWKCCFQLFAEIVAGRFIENAHDLSVEKKRKKRIFVKVEKVLRNFTLKQ